MPKGARGAGVRAPRVGACAAGVARAASASLAPRAVAEAHASTNSNDGREERRRDRTRLERGAQTPRARTRTTEPFIGGHPRVPWVTESTWRVGADRSLLSPKWSRAFLRTLGPRL